METAEYSLVQERSQVFMIYISESNSHVTEALLEGSNCTVVINTYTAVVVFHA